MLTWTKTLSDGYVHETTGRFRIGPRHGGRHALYDGDRKAKRGTLGQCKAEAERLAGEQAVVTQPTAAKPSLSHGEIQAIVDGLVWQHGNNLLGHPERDIILSAVGLATADVTESMITVADRRARKRLHESFKAHNANPKRAFTVVVDGDPDLDPSMKVPPAPAPQVRRVKETPEDSTPSGNNDNGEENETMKTLKIAETDARRLLGAMGLNKAAKAPADRLAKRLKALPELAANAKAPEADADVKLFRTLSDAVQKGRPVEVESNGEETASPASTNGHRKAVAKKSKPDKADGSKKDMDRFGFPVGSSNAAVNAALAGSKKPLTFAELVEKTGLSPKQVRYSHLHKLESMGIVERVGKAWCVKK